MNSNSSEIEKCKSTASVVKSENVGSSAFKKDSSTVKDALKCVKVYVPIEGFDNKKSFEQNLAEGKVQLMSDTPASDFNEIDSIDDCLTIPLVQKYPNKEGYSTASSEFDKLLNANRQSDDSCDSLKEPNFNYTEIKQHHCDVCLQEFRRRRDLALHYLTHTEREKKRASKTIKRCEICDNIPKQCRCKSNLEKINPFAKSLPNCLSLFQPINASVMFVKAELISGNSTVMKRELFRCPECKIPFGLESQLKQHVLYHKRERAKKEKEKTNFECNICNQKFTEEINLASHITNVHSISFDTI